MREKTLLVIIPSPQALAGSLAQATLDHWSGPDRPAVTTHSLAELVQDPAILGRPDAVWLLADGADSRGLFEIVAVLQDHQIPAMITRPGEQRPLGAAFRAGVLAAPVDSPPVACQALLRTLWTESEAIRELQRENRVLRAHHGGLCVQINKIDEELRLAAQLQREFMPTRLPELPEVQFQVMSRPAGYVSGDVYEVARLDEHHVALFIADAVGHGVPAALMTVFIKQSLRTKEIDHSLPNHYRLVPPGQVLAQVNQSLLQHQTGRVRTATAWYGVLDTRSLVLEYARAGHPVPVVLKADGSMQPLRSEGSLLGVFPEERFEECRLQLGAGDRVLAYSDGFEMAFADQDGPDRKRHAATSDEYTQQFRDLAHGDLGEALRRLTDKLDQQSGSLNQVDDMTVVCMAVVARNQVPALPPRRGGATAGA